MYYGKYSYENPKKLTAESEKTWHKNSTCRKINVTLMGVPAGLQNSNSLKGKVCI
jgi:hypothetical protein